MITRKNSKKALGSSPHDPETFLIRFNLSSIVLASEVVKWRIVFFHGDCCLLITFFDMGDTKMKMTTPCLPRQVGSKHVLFNVERFIWKFDLRSRSDHDPSRTICTSSEATRRAKSLGTIYASPSPSCRDLLAKNGLWRHLTSGDLPVTPDRQLHPDLHRWGQWPWSWTNWVVLIGLWEIGSTFIFPHRLIMGRSRNLPDLRSPG